MPSPWSPTRLAQMREAFGTSYQIMKTVEVEGVTTFLVCLWCGFARANPTDIAEKYCGQCHRFHEDQQAP